ncbi:Rrf2 family transcriptional regulator [Viridibacillus sp. YIM B01967]|uniref:Rrf2 family transcriptional regulator n=1 Tax=Viridibacillus soli TaxID=2798301 RepID=A0ABS1H5B0_9BACL|nr:Rrf2 family transcriptional regulator [Viridibacillus soli]MBK3494581.1 Rrf2 family transcriptional regulator [Viridibacillus soli]
MVNSRVSVAIHILSLIATTNDANQLTSDWIAGSVNTNPVVIRRISSQLKKANLIASNPGVAGYQLVKEPKDITLLDIYRAVQAPEELFAIHDNPNPECAVGQRIQSTLNNVYHSVQRAMEDKLTEETLQDVLDQLFH